jgi:hypothetical protein
MGVMTNNQRISFRALRLGLVAAKKAGKLKEFRIFFRAFKKEHRLKTVQAVDSSLYYLRLSTLNDLNYYSSYVAK